MSHHLDTPLAAQTGQLYLDDLYVFPGPGSTVFIMDVNSNVNGLHSEPGFHPEARYEFKVHFDGADVKESHRRCNHGQDGTEIHQRTDSGAIGTAVPTLVPPSPEREECSYVASSRHAAGGADRPAVPR